jgi:hypothetical protein
VDKKKAGSMSHFSRPPQLLKLSHNGRKPNLIRSVRHQFGESRQTSEKWSQTYILSISGSFNAVLEQTNSKLPETSDDNPGYPLNFRQVSQDEAANYSDFC